MAEINNVIAEASRDLQTIEDFVNLPAGSDVRPRLLPSVNVGTLAGARQAIFEAGGLPATPFATKALMTASALVDGKYAMVTDDTDDLNGLYVKNGAEWIKSRYGQSQSDFFHATNTEVDGKLLRYRQGGIDNSGNPTNEKNKLRTLVYIDTTKGAYYATKADDVKFQVCYFGETISNAYFDRDAWQTKPRLAKRPAYTRIQVAYTDDREITDENMQYLIDSMVVMASQEDMFDRVNRIDAGYQEGLNNVQTRLSKLEQTTGTVHLPNKTPLRTSILWTQDSIPFFDNLGAESNYKQITYIKGSYATDYFSVSKGDFISIKCSEGVRGIVLEYTSQGADPVGSPTWFTGLRELIIPRSEYVRIVFEPVEGAAPIKSIKESVKVYFENASEIFIDNSNGVSNLVLKEERFTLGSYNTSQGSRSLSTARAISSPLLFKDLTLDITPPEGWKVYIVLMDKDLGFVRYINWFTEPKTEVLNGLGHIRLLVAKPDDSTLTQEEVDSIRIADIVSVNPTSSTDTQAKGNAEYYYRSPELPSIPVGINYMEYAEFIQSTWDTLLAEFPNNVEKSVVMKDTTDTFDIYEYSFTPENYDKTVLLVAGTHGNEYEGFWCLYYMMSAIYRNGYTHERLREAKHSTRFIIIPVLNPWGMQNNKRTNVNNIDYNYNYGVFFGNPEYTSNGSSAFSENESQALQAVADKYKHDLNLFVDLHTDPYEPQWGNYAILAKCSPIRDEAIKVYEDEIAHLNNEYGFTTSYRLPPDNPRSYGYKHLEVNLGVPAAIIEISVGGMLPTGVSELVTVGVDWFVNFVTELTKRDFRIPVQKSNALEYAVIQDRIEGYANSVANKIYDHNLYGYFDQKDFDGVSWDNKAKRGSSSVSGTLSTESYGINFSQGALELSSLPSSSDFSVTFKGTIRGNGSLLTTNSGLSLQVVASSRSGCYDIKAGTALLKSSALKYNQEVIFTLTKKAGSLVLRVKSEYFDSAALTVSNFTSIDIGSNSPIDASFKNIVFYMGELSDRGVGYVVRSLLVD